MSYSKQDDKAEKSTQTGSAWIKELYDQSASVRKQAAKNSEQEEMGLSENCF